MKKGNFSFKDKTGLEISGYKWTDDKRPKAILQIVHGMAEHAARYDDLATFLVKSGIYVYANHHRGHGKTAKVFGRTGHLADKDGWDLTVENLYDTTLLIKKEYPETPVFIMGHSMGSLLVRDYLTKFADKIQGAILSGTSYNPIPLIYLGILLAKFQGKLLGKNHRSALLNKMSFGAFNNKFKPNRTAFDWLSRDEAMVDLYVKDEFCGFRCTIQFYIDLFNGILKVQKRKAFENVKENISIYLFSGTKDPVGNFTKGVKKVHANYERAGITDITLKFYEDARHETLNESNRMEVYRDLEAWILKRVKK